MNNKIGVMAGLEKNKECFTALTQYQLKCCQLVSWNPSIWTEELAKTIKKEAENKGILITSFWSGYSGPAAWNFTEGPLTLGLVPPTFRAQRIADLRRAADFAKALGVKAIVTHAGFIPENALDTMFIETVIAIREVTSYCAKLGLEFWFETGQETPTTLLRTIKAVGTNNLGINLDPANLILYGKASPVDALDVFGEYVRNIHAKDGCYPTDPMQLGREVKVGDGKVNYPLFMKRLKEIGFAGEFIIEREISGEQQAKDIMATVSYLKNVMEGIR
jgi:sugar phosphate isomerase/epimerase